MSTSCRLNQERESTKRNERVTLIVVVITVLMMIAEIIGGLLSGSMALLSDGIHMGTHALALLVTLAAYIFARRHRQNPSFAFGTGKVGVLGGYTNAILLIIAGLAMAYESVERLLFPVSIHFDEAIAVAVIGLLVNISCALILSRGEHGHTHRHQRDADNHHQHKHRHKDQNLYAAYLHVITDALTSILAIAALLIGKTMGWVWADPAVGILGAIVVIRWALGLIRQTAAILLDVGDFTPEITEIRKLLEQDGAIVKDIHIWQISENERSLIVSLQTDSEKMPRDYHAEIARSFNFEHVTIEVNRKHERFPARVSKLIRAEESV